MLTGSIWDKLLKFALPLAATGILQQLFNSCDSAVVGRFAGGQALAAVGSNTPVVALIVNLFIGVSVGVNVILARYIGSGNKKRISPCVHTAILFSLLIGSALAIISQFIAPALLRLLSVPDDVFPLAVLYLRIYCAGLPVIFLYNYESSIFRSRGDSKTPLLALVIGGITNVCLNLFFVIVLNMSVAGVAIATVMSNLISSAILAAFLLRRNDEFKLCFNKLKIDKTELIISLKIGLPAGLNGMVFSISNVCVQNAINALGSSVIAGSTAALNLEYFTFMFYNSFSQATTTFVSQNYGAGNIERTRRVTRIALLWSVALLTVISATMLLFGNQLIGIFVTSAEIISIGLIRFRIVFLTQWINTINDIVGASLRGYGQSLIPAVISLITICGTRIIGVNTYCVAHPGYLGIVLLYPLSWILNSAVLLPVYARFIKRVKI